MNIKTEVQCTLKVSSQAGDCLTVEIKGDTQVKSPEPIRVTLSMDRANPSMRMTRREWQEFSEAITRQLDTSDYHGNQAST